MSGKNTPRGIGHGSDPGTLELAMRRESGFTPEVLASEDAYAALSRQIDAEEAAAAERAGTSDATGKRVKGVLAPEAEG